MFFVLNVGNKTTLYLRVKYDADFQCKSETMFFTLVLSLLHRLRNLYRSFFDDSFLLITLDNLSILSWNFFKSFFTILSPSLPDESNP